MHVAALDSRRTDLAAVTDRWATSRNLIEICSSLSRDQRAGGVVEQLIHRHAARYQLLPMAELDDDFQNGPAGLDAEPVGIERAAVRQAGSPLARVQLAEDVLDRV